MRDVGDSVQTEAGVNREVLGPGAIVLAAYRPPSDLFSVQLRSIQAQSVTDFVCIISADGEAGEVAQLVSDAVDGDPRFKVIGFDDRLGFYGNFERALKAVPLHVRWIALSDQDDRWYPEKLERLVPHLERYSLVSGQSRVVALPGERVVSENTGRQNIDPEFYVIENQFTGGSTVFRRDVLERAIPFPRLATASEFHDHWLAVCAASLDGSRVVDIVVQDYVQHGGNVIGEGEEGLSLRRSLSNMRRLSQKFEGSQTVGSWIRTVYNVGVGWREVMTQTLEARAPESAVAQRLAGLYGPGRSVIGAMATVGRGVVSGAISVRAGLEYSAGLVLGAVCPSVRGGARQARRWQRSAQ